jgi:Holliday junction resolvase RusA-like endonuclease
VFWLPRPQSSPRWRWLSSTRPDVDKLARSTLDALSRIVYVDDARIADLSVRKLYALDRPPGALVRVQPLGVVERERGHAWQLTGERPKL